MVWRVFLGLIYVQTKPDTHHERTLLHSQSIAGKKLFHDRDLGAMMGKKLAAKETDHLANVVDKLSPFINLNPFTNFSKATAIGALEEANGAV